MYSQEIMLWQSQVISERDILGTQLVRRNDELALLYEKIKIQQSTLTKGEMQYRQRLEDIRLLKLEIKKLRREKNILNKSVANVDDLRWVTVWSGIYWCHKFRGSRTWTFNTAPYNDIISHYRLKLRVFAFLVTTYSEKNVHSMHLVNGHICVIV